MFEKVSTQQLIHANTQPLTSTIIVDLMLYASLSNTLYNGKHLQNFLWGVSHSTEWSEKKNPVEDNLLKNNYRAAFRLKKIPALLVRWEKKILPLKNIPTPLRPQLKSQMARPLLFF